MGSFFYKNKSPHEWLIPIEKDYPALKAKYDSLELKKDKDIQSYNTELSNLILDWCAVVNNVRTIFEKKNDGTVYIPNYV